MPEAKYKEGELLVRFKPGTSPGAIAAFHRSLGVTVIRAYRIVNNLYLVQLPPGLSVKEAIALYRKDKNVLYAEPNFMVEALASQFPNDSLFDQLWGLHNTGQGGGTPDADIDAPEAWGITTGSPEVVIAVIDTGIDYRHPDLAGNIWTNPGETSGDGIDNDGNGYVDDVYGIDAFNNDSDPMDDNNHGTHVAGTIGAVGDNEIGVVGVNWNVRLMALKFLSSGGWGWISGAITCLEYVALMKDRGVNIIATNNSWGGGGFSQALYDAIDVHRQKGILFVAAAGNGASDHDPSPELFSPSGYYLPNIISVAATTRHDALAWFSDYGRRTVHLGAPGHGILSTVIGGDYETFSGTSMAAPHVAGVAALLKAQDPTRDWKAIKNLILAGGDDIPALANTITQKRLNAHGALSCSGSVILSRLRPTVNDITAGVGTPVHLSVLHIQCAAPNGEVTVTVSPGGETVILKDDGVGVDQEAGDGIYSGQWTPSSAGIFTLAFPGDDVVTVRVMANYSYSVVPFRWRDTSAAGINLNLGDDDSVCIGSPFSIRFGEYGEFDYLYVGANGNVNFTTWFWEWTNFPIPCTLIETLVAPFWDDLFAVRNTSENVFVAVLGTAPNRELVIEWRDVRQHHCRRSPGVTVKFQIVFFEGRGDILFQYADTIFGGGCSWADRGASASVGVQISANTGTQYSFNEAALTDGLAILWTTGEAPLTYTLTIGVQGQGTTTPEPGSHPYPANTVVELSATPAEGWRFVCWEGPVANPNSQTTSVTMDEDKTVTAVFGPLFDLFFEDFDDITGWTRTGLWHIRSVPECVECGNLAGKFAYYARPGFCDYNTGRRTTGILTSPEITLPTGLAQVTVSFDSFRDVERPAERRGTFDRTYVQVRFMVGRAWRGWTTMWTKSSRDASSECGSFSRVVNVPRGATKMQVRFVFDSVDARNNAYKGWAVDNVGVRSGALPGASALAPLDAELEEAEPEPMVLEVLPYPNPVRDVHTTVFRVMGVEAEALKVEIYDLTGRLVWKAEAPGNELVWHTQDLTGLPLANGVYLYIAYVRVGGSWVATEVQKVVILR